MDLPKAIINDYTDYLGGKEVGATIVSDRTPVEKGMRVMGFHNSIATNTGLTVPKEKQAQYLGVEGTVTAIDSAREDRKVRVRVVKA